MDALALLCTLYGEGPKTRSRLRKAGWDSVELIVELDPNDLSRTLYTSVEGAQRFQREARQLAGRLGIGLDTEETALPTELLPAPALAARAASPATPQVPEAESPAAAEREATEKEAGYGCGLSKVLERWHELADQQALESREAPSRSPSSSASDAAGAGSVPGQATDPDWIPRPAQPPAGPVLARDSLFPGAFDGCTAEIVAELGRASITTLVDLIAADPLELAAATSRPFLECSRWKFLARRVQRELHLSPANTPSYDPRSAPGSTEAPGARSPGARSPRARSPRARSPAEPEGSGGPFA